MHFTHISVPRIARVLSFFAVGRKKDTGDPSRQGKPTRRPTCQLVVLPAFCWHVGHSTPTRPAAQQSANMETTPAL